MKNTVVNWDIHINRIMRKNMAMMLKWDQINHGQSRFPKQEDLADVDGKEFAPCVSCGVRRVALAPAQVGVGSGNNLRRFS